MLQKIKSFAKGAYEKLPGCIISATRSLVAIALVFATLMTAVFYATHTVRISDGKDTYVITTVFDTPHTAMKKISFDSQYQITSMVKGLFSTDITISYVFPLTITIGDHTETYTVSGGRLGDILTQIGITVDEYDIVAPSLDTVISEETYVDIVDIEYKTESYSESIPYTSTVEYSNQYDTSTKKTEAGVNGSKLVTRSVKYVNGVATQTTVVSEEITREAVTQKTVIGTKAPQYASASSVSCISTLKAPSSLKLDANGVPTNYSSVKTLRATAYSHTGNKCSTGVSPQPGYVAVDPDEIPYGTKMYIVSADGKYVYGYAIAADTGGFINGNRTDMDLFFDTKTECINFGRRDIKVYFLD